MRTTTAVACTLVLLAAPLAGCIGGDEDPEVEPDEQAGGEDPDQAAEPDGAGDAGDTATNQVDTFATNGSYTAEAYRLGLPGVTGEDRPAVTFEAPADAAQIVAEFEWSGTAATFDLVLFSPAYCQDEVTDVQPAVDDFVCAMTYYATEDDSGAYQADGPVAPAGEGQLRLVLDAEEVAESSCEDGPCEWRAYAFADAAVDVSFAMHVAVAHDEPLPEGYTGLDG